MLIAGHLLEALEKKRTTRRPGSRTGFNLRQILILGIDLIRNERSEGGTKYGLNRPAYH